MDGKYDLPEGSLISFMSNKVKSGGGINLAQGIPGFAPPEDLLDTLRSIAKKPIHQYPPGIGNYTLIEQLTEKYSRYFPVTADHLLIVNGATEALSLIFTYLIQKLPKPFSVLSFDPAYESYKHLPNIFNIPYFSFLPEPDGQINFDMLRHTIKKEKVKILFVSSPGNPLGKIFTSLETGTLLDMAQELDFYVIFDSVYEEIYFGKPPYIPLDKLNERLFYVNSFSKLFSITGWRIGFMIASQESIHAIRNIHDYIGLCSPSVLQEALAQFNSATGFGKEYISALRKKIHDSFSVMHKALTEMNFNIPLIEGGYFIYTRLPSSFDDGFRFAINLYECQNVAVIPGIYFSEFGKDHIRINIAREMNEIEESIERLKKFVLSAGGLFQSPVFQHKCIKK